MSPKEVKGKTAAERSNQLAADGYEVFKKYSGENGIKAEYQRRPPTTRRSPSWSRSAKPSTARTSSRSRSARTRARTRTGRSPSVLYASAQHAREWITPEMNRRLMHHMIDNYGSDPKITKIVDKNELWFIPVSNPDGYDFTFEPDQRLWRKNLRDNNNDGVIGPGDGVDLNRNYKTKWGYDNEGSSPNTGSETYRGPSAGSEPETKALDSFAKKIGFEFLVNYHSAAQLLLYGTGWQVSTPTPDDAIYETMAGDDEHPAVPGYDPDISAELYTTNGDTDTHLTRPTRRSGSPRRCPRASRHRTPYPNDEWEAADCESGFNFPDDEGLVQAEFEKNIPFALSVAESAADPDDPKSVVGRTAPNFGVDSFDVSYGDPQTVAVVAKRALKDLRLTTPSTAAARSGQGLGVEGRRALRQRERRLLRRVPGHGQRGSPGDKVKVTFTGESRQDGRSQSFTYSLASDSGDDVLVLADEDYTGVNPDYPASAPRRSTPRARGGDQRRRLLHGRLGRRRPGRAAPPRRAQSLRRRRLVPRRQPAHPGSGGRGDHHAVGGAARHRGRRTQQYPTMAVRDYLNGGGKLVHAGETAQYSGLPGISDAVGGLFYGLNGDPRGVRRRLPARVLRGLPDHGRRLPAVLPRAFTRTDNENPDSVVGVADPLEGLRGRSAARSSRVTTRSTRPVSSSRPARCSRPMSSLSSPARVWPSTPRAGRTRSPRSRAPRTPARCTRTRPTCD